MIKQNLTVIAGELNPGLWRVHPKKSMIRQVALSGDVRFLSGAKITKLDESRASEIAKTLGITVLFGGIIGVAHAAQKKIMVQIDLPTGETALATTNANGYSLLAMHSNGHPETIQTAYATSKIKTLLEPRHVAFGVMILGFIWYWI